MSAILFDIQLAYLSQVLLLAVLTPLFLPSSAVFLSYFIFHSCCSHGRVFGMSSPFPIAILNGTCCHNTSGAVITQWTRPTSGAIIFGAVITRWTRPTSGAIRSGAVITQWTRPTSGAITSGAVITQWTRPTSGAITSGATTAWGYQSIEEHKRG